MIIEKVLNYGIMVSFPIKDGNEGFEDVKKAKKVSKSSSASIRI